jgi:mycothiol S-conjugate amidase
MLGLHEKFLELGLESPFGEDWMERMRNLEHDDRVTTLVPIAEHYDVREKALLAHATQVDPESPFWFGLPTEVARDVHPWDDYILARSLVDSEPPEDDLFAGIPGR